MMLQERFLSRVLWNWGAPVVQAAISIGMLPVITAVLGPADIGIYSLAAAFAVLVTALAGMGSTYIISAHYPTLPVSERPGLVSTLIILGMTVAAAAGVFLVCLWPIVAGAWDELAKVPPGAFSLLVAGSVIAVPWTIATDVLMLKGEAKRFALVGMMQSVIGALATVIGLYVFDLGVVALFVASPVASLVCGVAACVLLRREIFARLERRWLSECCRVGPVMSGGQLLEVLHHAIERTLLSRFVGFGALGLYAHSQQYRNMVQVGVKGLTRAVWPISLAEGRMSDRKFARTNSAWRATALLLSAVGVFFAFFGHDVVAALTHDKFTAAAPFVALWMAYILVQNLGKPQLAVLFVAQDGVALGWIGIAVRLLGIVLLFILVPNYGISGAFAALFLQQLAIRIAFYFQSRRFGSVPFQDSWIIGGCFAIGIACVAEQAFAASFVLRVGLFALAMMLMFIWGNAALREMMLLARSSLRIR